VNRQEQKAEFEAKNPPIDTSMYGWPYAAAVPYSEAFIKALCDFYGEVNDWEVVESDTEAPLTSLAHPEWPYAGTAFEWSKFVKVKI
jgi:hypothetical protein